MIFQHATRKIRSANEAAKRQITYFQKRKKRWFLKNEGESFDLSLNGFRKKNVKDRNKRGMSNGI